MQLATACWPDLDGHVDVAFFPLGSCEQHGPHLPFVTDASVAEWVAVHACRELCAHGVRAVSAPVLAYGASGEHQHFPGTVSIGHEALRHVLVEIGRSASHWAPRIVFVNGHGGNLPTVSRAVQQLRAEGRDIAWLPCVPPDSDAHAGRTETSLMHAIAPASVRSSAAAPGATEPIRDLLPLLRERGVAGVSPNGVLGDPTGASAVEGWEMFDWMVTETLALVDMWDVAGDGGLRPRIPAPVASLA